MASTHLEAVQQGALHVDRAVKEYKRSRVPALEAEPEQGGGYASPEDVPEGKEESPEENPLVAQLRASLLESIRRELPPPPPPIEVRIITDSSGGSKGTLQWAFGLALSLWLVYNMD